MAPTPKWDPSHRHPRVGPVTLPAEGYSGPVPSWPLAGKLVQEEQRIWRQLWATPQAVVWAQMGAGTARVLARYARVLVLAESSNPVPQYLAQVTALEDRLGISPQAMRRLLWKTAETESAPVHQISSARGRIKAVDQEVK